MTKQFKILGKEPYKFTSKAGQVYDKCRYKTDSDLLDIFTMNLEIGQTYDFEEVEKEFKGKMYKNWVLAKPKSSLELRIEILEKKVDSMWEAKIQTKHTVSDNDDPGFNPGDESPDIDMSQIPF